MSEQRGVSVSQINNWMTCPYKLYLLYAKKCKPIYWKPEIFDIGSAVHDSAEAYYKHHYSSAPSNSDYILYWLYEEFKLIWDFKKPLEDYKKAYKCLEYIAKYEFERVKISPYLPHAELTKDIAGYYIKVDVFDEFLVKGIDWKTSASGSIGRGEKIQSIVYKTGLDALFKIDLPEFNFVFPFVDVIKTVDFSDKKVVPLFDEVKDAKDQIQKSFQKWSFEKNPKTPKTCNWCELRYYCKKLKI